METQRNRFKVSAKPLFPHETLMETYKLKVEKLSENLQHEIELFEKSYLDKYYDGVLDDQEEAELYRHSNQIAELIKREYGIKEKGSGGVILGLLTGIGLGVLAYFGIKKLNQ